MGAHTKYQTNIHPSTPKQPKKQPNQPDLTNQNTKWTLFFALSTWAKRSKATKRNSYNAFLRDTLRFHLDCPDLLFFFLLPFRFTSYPFSPSPPPSYPPFGPFCPFCQSETIALALLCLLRFSLFDQVDHGGPMNKQKAGPITPFRTSLCVPQHNPSTLFFFFFAIATIPLCLPFLNSLQTRSHTLGKKERTECRVQSQGTGKRKTNA